MTDEETKTVEGLLTTYPRVVPGMIEVEDLRALLLQLCAALQVRGAVVEFGCNQGTASLFITRLLQRLSPEREFHVYDSFLGFPDVGPGDGPDARRGDLTTTAAALRQNFASAGLPVPTVHEGWFSELTGRDVPGAIAFAYLDADLYASTLDALSQVYPRLVPGGRIVVHDFANPVLPGARSACEAFNAELGTQPGFTQCARDMGLLVREADGPGAR